MEKPKIDTDIEHACDGQFIYLMQKNAFLKFLFKWLNWYEQTNPQIKIWFAMTYKLLLWFAGFVAFVFFIIINKLSN